MNSSLRRPRHWPAPLVLRLAIGLLLCPALPAPGQSRPTQPTDVALIPRATIFGNPDHAAARLSPDGKHLAFLAPCDGVLNVWVGPPDDPDQTQPLTHDKNRGIRGFSWTYTNEHLLYTQDRAGDENWRIFAVHLPDGKIRDITPDAATSRAAREAPATARIEKLSPKHPDEVLISINDRDPRYHDVYRVNIASGASTPLLRNTGAFAGFIIDDDFNVRYATHIESDGGVKLLQPDDAGKWTAFLDIPSEDALTTDPIGFDPTGRRLVLLDSRGRNTAALTEVNTATKRRTTLSQDPRTDAVRVLQHPLDDHVQAVGFEYQRLRWKVVDNDIRPDLERLASSTNGDFFVTSRTLDDSRWVVAFWSDDSPLRYGLYDRGTRKLRFLFASRSQLEGRPLAAMHPVVIRSRDGLNLVAYLTLPVGSNPAGSARPRQPLPMVLDVHGGPWGRDSWGYDPIHQWLANRGYAVLSVNFRGSTGFGKNFVNAGDREWARRMHDDLIDAVQWSIGQEIAQPDKIAIVGASYGGYASLVGLTFTPNTFACGIDIVGPSNLVTLLESIPAYWTPMVELFARRVGDPRTDDGRTLLWERSPLRLANQIARPLLIGQGANDVRVKRNESDRVVEALQARGIPVTYVVYPDEGHGFARPENRLAFYAVAEAFLAQHLGGRVEPVGDDFSGSSIQVPVGVERVPGVAESLSKRPADHD